MKTTSEETSGRQARMGTRWPNPLTATWWWRWRWQQRWQ